ncbi:hypothetical protein JCM1840_001074 [Sporobolomyces johnsonii]
MNLELLNPFSTSFPENFDTSIDAAALCARFNPSGVFAGHYLAVGRLDGVVAVLDFETKNIVRWLEGHVKAVTSVCWSHNSRYLLTASRDWNAIIWDLSASAFNTVAGERRHTVRFDAPVTSAALHPRNSKMLVVTLHAQTQPVFVDLRRETEGRWELETPPDEDEEEEEDEDEAPRRNREIATLARFSPRGDLIYVGTSRGNIHIWDVQTKEWLWTEYTGSYSAIKHLEFNNKGTGLVINSNDRCIRVLSLSLSPPAPESSSDMDEDAEVPEPPPPRPPRIPYFEVMHRFQDLVNRTPWNGCGFSSDGEYVIGGAGHKGSHNIYIWDRDSGGLVKILEGPKDPLEDLDWHPLRPLIASVSSLGLIHIWVTPIVENWSAHAPGFEELDENREYEEKEDEFDIEDETILKRRRADAQDVPVDILTTTLPAGVRSLSPSLDDAPATAAFEAFIALEPDEDADEAFYPATELDDVYEEEGEVPQQQTQAEAQARGVR